MDALGVRLTCRHTILGQFPHRSTGFGGFMEPPYTQYRKVRFIFKRLSLGLQLSSLYCGYRRNVRA